MKDKESRIEVLHWIATFVAIFAVGLTAFQVSQTFRVLREGQVIASIAASCSEHIAITSRINRRLTSAASRFHSARASENLQVALELSARDGEQLFQIFNEVAHPTYSQLVIFSKDSDRAELGQWWNSYRESFYNLQRINGIFIIQVEAMGIRSTVATSDLLGVGSYDDEIDESATIMHQYTGFIYDYCRRSVAI
ncbi:hypothetical protein L2D00_05920 [Hyphomonadaceae bacterium BL14]|nr:hypothetical protein L2D00_05920 [Hyphomonadaceae bacterium BL14]